MVIPVSTCMGTWTVPKGITDILNLEQAPLVSYSKQKQGLGQGGDGTKKYWAPTS